MFIVNFHVTSITERTRRALREVPISRHSRQSVLLGQISLENLWEKFRGHGKSASGLGLVAFVVSQSTPRFVPLAPNPGDAGDIICSFINIFLVVFHDMHNELDFTEVISMRRR